MELNGELTDQDMKAPESQVFSYTAPWLIYALGFSNRKGCDYRIGIGSFLQQTDNQVQIIQLNEETQQFEAKITFPHKYPPTKLLWIPDLKGESSDKLATSGESLKIWEINNDSKEATL